MEHGGFAIAAEWRELPPEDLEIALKALEPQLAREHALRMAVIDADQEREHRALVAQVAGQVAGLLVSLCGLAGSVLMGMRGQPWLAGLLCGPAVFALAKLFVLRRGDIRDSRQMAMLSSAAVQGQPPTTTASEPVV